MTITVRPSWILALVMVGLFAAWEAHSYSQAPAIPRHIKSADLREGAPYSSGVLAGDTLYLSGRTGGDRATGELPGDLDQEVRNILDGHRRTLEDAGMTMDDLVWVQVYCPDVALYDQFNAVYRTYFDGDLPARAFLGSGALLHGAHFEVSAIAVRR